MNQNFEKDNDELEEEYDFTQLKVVRRGSGRMPKQVLVDLALDVAEKFPMHKPSTKHCAS
jgi:hypothetical protein